MANITILIRFNMLMISFLLEISIKRIPYLAPMPESSIIYLATKMDRQIASWLNSFNIDLHQRELFLFTLSMLIYLRFDY